MGKPAGPCPHCRRLAVERRIEDSHQFERVAVLIDEALGEGFLVPDPIEPWGKYQEPLPYAVMREEERTGVRIPDAIDYYFRCQSCNRRFELCCNFYHGGGGTWGMVS